MTTRTAASTLAAIVRATVGQLEDAGVDNPSLDARLLIGHVLGLDRAQILAQGERAVTPDENDGIKSLIGRRCRREPVARILGKREFWSLDFSMNDATLEPRPDSETLVEVVLTELKDRSAVTIFDLGTGTGCLLLALLSELPQATGLGVDYTPHAVDQARDNAEALRLGDRAIFRISNWMDNIDSKFDVIISNPPYIPSKNIPTLMPEVRNYDPLAALDGGEDGLAVYRLIVPQVRGRLNAGGFVVFEVGEGQAESVGELFRQNGFANVTYHMDLSGLARCVKASD
ncbi:MAG: peptide chain release factor N(5)-glutamine methyltransferase [Pseudomonadota bacterium]|nr:peptide chain release factor N(5)-glutamine methyltransferase [Pseudomonadota bacterium]